MTVISRSINHLAPIIASDLLVSEEDSEEWFVPPAEEYLSEEFIRSIKYRPVGLAQKIYVLSENVCIAVAGMVSELKQLLEDLGLFCRAVPNLTAGAVREFLRSYGLEHLQECGFFLMLVERDSKGKIDVTEISMGEFSGVDSKMFDQSTAIGSGAEDFLKILSQDIRFHTSAGQGNIMDSVLKQGSLIAHLLVLERGTKDSLRKGWGGAYEFAVYDGGRFVKPDNVAYIVNAAQADQQGTITMPKPVFILHHRYEGNTLVLTKVFWKNHIWDDNGKDMHILRYTDIDVQVYLAPSLTNPLEATVDLLQVRSFETQWIGMGYHIATQDYLSVMPAFFTASKDMKVSFNDETSVVEVYLRNSFVPTIQKLILDTAQAIRRSK